MSKFARLISFSLMTLVCFNASYVQSQVMLKGPANFADIVAPLLPSVVNISTTTEYKKDKRMSDMLPQLPPGTPLEEFFRQYMEEGGPSARPRKASSLGSGFILSQEGDKTLVVTCNHVIADADVVKVILHEDPTEYEAKVLGRDPRTDLALLEIKVNKKLSVASWGDSEKLRVGDWVVAIGNPFGLSSTVTTGIVSTIARDISGRARGQSTADYVDGYIQTDASINLGSSGGPMFDLNGKVVGISTAIFSPNGGNIGIGFAIPSRIAQDVIEQLKSMGRTKRGWIGVKVQPISADEAESLGLKAPKGALVADVTKGGPGEKSGLQSGDVILEFNANNVKDSRSLPMIVGKTPIGKEVPVSVWRSGKEVKLKIKVGEFEKAEQEGLITTKPEELKSRGKKVESVLGCELADDPKGVVIAGVVPGSDAEEKGLAPGDIIVALISEPDQKDVKKVDDVRKFLAVLKKQKKTKVLVKIKTEGGLRFLTLNIEDEVKTKEVDREPKGGDKSDGAE